MLTVKQLTITKIDVLDFFATPQFCGIIYSLALSRKGKYRRVITAKPAFFCEYFQKSFSREN